MTVNEIHAGEKYDATNIIRAPIVTAVTSIAMYHVKLFGPSIENIAWHKARIFKSGSLAFSTLQENVVTTVLQQRTTEKGAKLEFVSIDPTLPTEATALKPNVQKIICSLALSAVHAWFSVKEPKAQSHTEDFLACGIKQSFCPR